jgi:hypothetical protein
LYVFSIFRPSGNGKTIKNVKIQEKGKRTLETGFLERSFFLILFLDPSRLDNRRIATTNNNSNQRQQHKQTQTQTQTQTQIDTQTHISLDIESRL